jgi:D-alanyl-D-alanine carboxypeptidase
MTRTTGLLAICLSSLLFSTYPRTVQASAGQDEIQSFMDETVQSCAPGIAMYVSDGSEDWVGSAGFADVESGRLLTVDDTFPVFSVTKTFTAIVVLQLIQEGKLSFDDTLGSIFSIEQGTGPIGKIPYATEITIRQLLDHSSGIFDFANSPNYLFATLGPDADYAKEWTSEDKFSIAHPDRNQPTAKPGDGSSYTSTGYELLGLVVAKVADAPLQQVLSERIFKPLDLADTYLAT